MTTKQLSRSLAYSFVAGALWIVACTAGCGSSGRSVFGGRPDASDNAVAAPRPSDGVDDDEDASLKEVAALAASDPGKADAVDRLIRMTRSRSPTVRSHAARALGHVATDRKDAIGRLADMVGDPEPQVAAQAAVAIRRIATSGNTRGLDGPITDKVTRELVRGCGSPDSAQRRASLETLLLLNPDPAVVVPIIKEAFRTSEPDALIPLLGTLADMREKVVPLLRRALEDPASAYWASVVARDIGPAAEALIPVLSKIIGDDTADPSVRLQAVLAMGAIASPGADVAFDALVRCLEAKESSLRTAAAFALGKLEAKSAEPALRRASKDGSEIVAAMAAWSLARLRPDDEAAVSEAVGKLTALLVNDNPATRVMILSAIADICGSLVDADKRKVASEVAGFLRDPDPAVGSAAGLALQRMGPLAVGSLISAVRDQASRKPALAALSAGGKSDASLSVVLIPLLTAGTPDEVVGACLAIAATGGFDNTAINYMTSILADPARSADERRTAAYALGRCGPAAEVGLQELRAARKPDDPLLSVLVTWAIARIRPADSAAVSNALDELGTALTTEDEFVRQAAELAIDDLRTSHKAATKEE